LKGIGVGQAPAGNIGGQTGFPRRIEKPDSRPVKNSGII